FQLSQVPNGNRKQDICFIPWYHESYPKKLRQISGYPFAVFVKGRLPDEKAGSVAIIGARNCSEYGRSMARYFGEELARSGVQVISGMAYGVDGIGQMCALEAGGYSCGILGCGVDVCYPASNQTLYARLAKQGGLLSEYCPGTPPVARQFPPRNRIISGLSDIVLVVEARKKSGTLITVDMALEQGKEILVVPGRVTDPLSSGCNSLLKQGASPVTEPSDVLALLEGKYEIKVKKTKKEKIMLESNEKLVYCCCGLYAKNLEDIASEVSCSYTELLHTLVSLELKGYIREISKNYYVRTS
ncbi:MAG TPA: DNA-processing protein DprA, partial [Lachnospiraceae bacterium]|nr:DNA-processing protein DprA [Lachnospiraceae bacterium]